MSISPYVSNAPVQEPETITSWLESQGIPRNVVVPGVLNSSQMAFDKASRSRCFP